MTNPTRMIAKNSSHISMRETLGYVAPLIAFDNLFVLGASALYAADGRMGKALIGLGLGIALTVCEAFDAKHKIAEMNKKVEGWSQKICGPQPIAAYG